METIWFALLVFTLASYVVLDGFDLGVGLLSPWVARSEPERRQLYRSIGPVWDGNEVWLLAAGGAMFLAFPQLLATGLSGFYLPIMLVLWLLLFRALSIELRHQLHDPMWTKPWDTLFFLSSGLLIVLFGAALGNVVRGVAFGADGTFFAPLWTSFTPRAPIGALDWFTLSIALEALIVLGLHGGLWLEWRTDEAVRARAGALVDKLLWAALGGAVVCTTLSLVIQPRLLQNLSQRPAVYLAALPISALLAIPALRRRGLHGPAFCASATHLYGLLAAAAFSLYPTMLPGVGGTPGLDVAGVKAADYSLRVGLYWWLPALLLVLACQRFVYGRMPRTFSVHDDAGH